MTDEAAAHVRRLRGRLIVMLAIDVACVIVALAALVAWLGLHLGWAAWAFVAATVTGFVAQIWLLVDFARSRPPS